MNKHEVFALVFEETRIHQRRKELEEIRQKSNRFNLSIVHLQSDTDRLLHMIDKAPDVNISFFFHEEIQLFFFCLIECRKFSLGNRFYILCIAVSWTGFEEVLRCIKFIGY